MDGSYFQHSAPYSVAPFHTTLHTTVASAPVAPGPPAPFPVPFLSYVSAGGSATQSQTPLSAVFPATAPAVYQPYMSGYSSFPVPSITAAHTVRQTNSGISGGLNMSSYVNTVGSHTHGFAPLGGIPVESPQSLGAQHTLSSALTASIKTQTAGQGLGGFPLPFSTQPNPSVVSSQIFPALPAATPQHPPPMFEPMPVVNVNYTGAQQAYPPTTVVSATPNSVRVYSGPPNFHPSIQATINAPVNPNCFAAASVPAFNTFATPPTGYNEPSSSHPPAYKVHRQSVDFASGARKSGGIKRSANRAIRHVGTTGAKVQQRSPIYCEVCKISCAGLQTYKEHVNGQRHKKKMQASSDADGLSIPNCSTKTCYKCELCGVVCAGKDAYTAHVKGSRHIRTLRIFETMGKPLPSLEPTKIPPKHLNAPDSTAKRSDTDDAGCSDVSVHDTENEVQPVGENYVEVSGNGKSATFHCKLCDCQFSDLMARDMHLKGRRHRLQYKRKVDPTIEVEVRMNSRLSRRLTEMHYLKMQYMNRAAHMPHEPHSFGWGFRRDALTMFEHKNEDERYLVARHALIYPTDEEMERTMALVVNVENTLKAISDHFTQTASDCSTNANAGTVRFQSFQQSSPNDDELAANVASSSSPTMEDVSESEVAPAPAERLLKGVMRVGQLAKALLLRGHMDVQMVVLSNERPTKSLLYRIYENMQKFYDKLSCKPDVSMTISTEDGVIRVVSRDEPRVTVSLHLTSVLMRQDITDEELVNMPKDMLDQKKCAEVLAWLRRSKWFQAKCAHLYGCVEVLRVLKDLCHRIPTWSPFPEWALELLTEKVMSSCPLHSAAIVFRRVFEAIASGILFSDSPGLCDPCEKQSIDTLGSLRPQEREDITALAQNALRMIAFGRINEVLGLDRLAPVPPAGRKRPFSEDSPMEEAAGEEEEPELIDGHDEQEKVKGKSDEL